MYQDPLQKKIKQFEGNEPKGGKMLHEVKELDTKSNNLSSIPELTRQKEKN